MPGSTRHPVTLTATGFRICVPRTCGMTEGASWLCSVFFGFRSRARADALSCEAAAGAARRRAFALRARAAAAAAGRSGRRAAEALSARSAGCGARGLGAAAGVRARRAGPAPLGRGPAGARAASLRPRLATARDTHAVVDIVHAGRAFRDILDCVLHAAIRHRPFEDHGALCDFDRDFARVDVTALHELLTDVFLDALVGACVTLRPAALGAILVRGAVLSPCALGLAGAP